jgi:outer membrane lipoprotein SlyB
MPSLPFAPRSSRLAGIAALALALGAGLAGCAPTNTNTTYTAGGIGVATQVRYGTIIGMRPVAISGSQSGLGAGVGGVSGAVLGSTVGGDWRARTAMTVVGGLVGAGAGALIENSATSGQAVEFTIRPDGGGPDFSVVQTNELALQVGEPVAVSFGDRVRLARATREPGQGPQGYAPGYAPGYGVPAAGKK